MIKSKQLFSYVAAFIMICLNLTFVCKNLYADVGYVMLESYGSYDNYSLHDTNKIIKIEEVGSRYIYLNFSVIQKIAKDFEQKSNLESCGELSLRNGILNYLDNKKKECSFESLKLNYISEYVKSDPKTKIKILSYVIMEADMLFAFVEFSNSI